MAQKKRFNKYLKRIGWYGKISNQGLSNLQKIAEEEYAKLWQGDIKLQKDKLWQDILLRGEGRIEFKGICNIISQSKPIYDNKITIKDMDGLLNDMNKQTPPKTL